MPDRLHTTRTMHRDEGGAPTGTRHAWTTFVLGDGCWSIPSRDVVCHGALGDDAAVVAIERAGLCLAVADRRVIPVVDPCSYAWSSTRIGAPRAFLVLGTHRRRVAILAEVVRTGLHVMPAASLDLERIVRVRTLAERPYGVSLGDATTASRRRTMPALSESLRPSSRIPPARGVIAFADDEPMLVELAFATLGREGYEVLLASDGDDALRVVEEDGGRLALIVLDWAMPGIAGRALVQAIRAKHPSLAIVISSGNIDEVMRDLDGFDTNIHALQKPWRTRTLLTLIAQLT